jgi:Leucine-rich repeat (LRR) protein
MLTLQRLAINHNEISSFPARLVECKRLRYLNARNNLFIEIPRTVRLLCWRWLLTA